MGQDPRLSPEDQRRRLDLYVLSEMARVLNWSVTPTEWHNSSPRLKRLGREADAILAARDAPAAFMAWRDAQS